MLAQYRDMGQTRPGHTRPDHRNMCLCDCAPLYPDNDDDDDDEDHHPLGSVVPWEWAHSSMRKRSGGELDGLQ